MAAPTPPGWYDDPYGTPGLQRYWDGAQWTQATQPTGSEEPAAPEQEPSQPWASPDAAPGWSPAPGPFTPPGPPQGPLTPPPPQGQFTPPAPPQGQFTPPGPAPGPAPGAYGQPGHTVPPGPMLPGGTPVFGPPFPARAGKGNGALLALLGGGAAVLLVITLVAVLFGTGVIGGDTNEGGSGEPTPFSSRSTSTPTPQPDGRSPVVGTVTDPAAGLTYAQLGGQWTNVEVSATLTERAGFTRGQEVVVQRNYDGAGAPYLANVFSGTLPAADAYTGKNDLKTATERFLSRVEPDFYPEPRIKRQLESKSYTVSGKPGWLYKVRLDFPTAQANRWNFRSETAVVVLMDRGEGQRPGLFYVSVPDSHLMGGDLDQLVGSLKAS